MRKDSKNELKFRGIRKGFTIEEVVTINAKDYTRYTQLTESTKENGWKSEVEFELAVIPHHYAIVSGYKNGTFATYNEKGIMHSNVPSIEDAKNLITNRLISLTEEISDLDCGVYSAIEDDKCQLLSIAPKNN